MAKCKVIAPGVSQFIDGQFVDCKIGDIIEVSDSALLHLITEKRGEPTTATRSKKSPAPVDAEPEVNNG